jgi:hypothetical protein
LGVKILSIASLIVVGAMVADALSHGSTTSSIINSFGSLWNNSISTVAGK